MTALWSSFLVVALAEMGDKTQLIALSLAAWCRRPWPVLWGILLATLLNHGLASSAGSWLAGMISPGALAWTLGVGFIAFGIWTLFPDRVDDRREGGRGWGPLTTTIVVFFLAEMGDKTQLATVALGARFQSATIVTIGTTMGMLAADSLAVFAGARFGQVIPMRRLRWVAAALFFALGGASMVAALGM
jgi:putative Ca2+/H+ antiporter (TMEM165/GDT1 family)